MRTVWLASYPKSGNTWMRVLLANLAAEDEGAVDINNLVLRGGFGPSARAHADPPGRLCQQAGQHRRRADRPEDFALTCTRPACSERPWRLLPFCNLPESS